MMKSYKVMLVPNKRQRTRLFQFAGAARFAYNWALNKEIIAYKNGEKFISNYDLRKEFTKLRNSAEYSWLKTISNNVTKQAIIDCCNAYEKFFKKQARRPRFKSKKCGDFSFYQDTYKIQITATHVKLESIAKSLRKNRQKLNWIKIAEIGRIPLGVKYKEPRITFDGLNWFLSVAIEFEPERVKLTDETLGIDFGIKNLAVCSDGTTYPNINKTKTVSKLKKKQRRLQRQISKKYLMNKKGESYCKTRNIIKGEKLLLKVHHRLKNIRQNYRHQITTEIVKRKPSLIVLEDLNVSGMLKNRYLSKSVQEQGFYELRRQFEYKASWHGIKIIVADRFYPSSKICCKCGKVKKDLKLSDRIYSCECGNVIDRDLNAAINLKNIPVR
jgi:putative transposase